MPSSSELDYKCRAKTSLLDFDVHCQRSLCCELSCVSDEGETASGHRTTTLLRILILKVMELIEGLNE